MFWWVIIIVAGFLIVLGNELFRGERGAPADAGQVANGSSDRQSDAGQVDDSGGGGDFGGGGGDSGGGW